MPLGASSIQSPRLVCAVTHARTLSPCSSRIAFLPCSILPCRVIICRACDDREGRDSLEARDVPFLIRPGCKPERSRRSRRPTNKFSPFPCLRVALTITNSLRLSFDRSIDRSNDFYRVFMVSRYDRHCQAAS